MHIKTTKIDRKAHLISHLDEQTYLFGPKEMVSPFLE